MSGRTKSNLFIIISVIFLLLASYIITQKRVFFSESKHERNENYGANFDTYVTSRKGLTVSIDKQIYKKMMLQKSFYNLKRIIIV